MCWTQQLNSRLPAITHTFRGFKRTLSLFHLTANKAENSLCLGCLLSPRRAAPLAAFPITLPACSAGGTGRRFGVPLRCKPAWRNRLLGLERGEDSSSDSKVGIGTARVHAMQAHICPDTRTPTHTHAHASFQSPSRPSCLNFPLFPRGSPDLWHGGASHGATAPAAEGSGKEPHTNLCQLCSPFLAPRFEIYWNARGGLQWIRGGGVPRLSVGQLCHVCSDTSWSWLPKCYKTAGQSRTVFGSPRRAVFNYSLKSPNTSARICLPSHRGGARLCNGGAFVISKSLKSLYIPFCLKGGVSACVQAVGRDFHGQSWGGGEHRENKQCSDTKRRLPTPQPHLTPPQKLGGGGESKCEHKYTVKEKANRSSCTPHPKLKKKKKRERERERENPQTVLQSLNDTAVFC